MTSLAALAISMLSLLGTLVVPAPGLPPVLTLDGAVQLLRERSPDLLLAEAQVAAARADRASAGAIANPSFTSIPASCAAGLRSGRRRGRGWSRRWGRD